MGYVYANLILKNAKGNGHRPIQTKALVDSAAMDTCIPESVREQLGLDEVAKRRVVLADGQIVSVPYVGPLFVQFEDRQAFVGALVMGDEILLGAIAMEDMNVSIDPRTRTLLPNPPPWPGVVGGVRPAE